MLELMPIANTIILIIIAIYQKNKNKLLLDRIKSQGELLAESKNLIEQLTTGINGQGRIVETAMKYADGFDPGKFEDLIRKQVQIESDEEVAELRKKINQLRSDGKGTPNTSEINELLDDVTRWAAKEASYITLLMLLEPLMFYIEPIRGLPDEEARAQEIEKIDNDNLRLFVKSVLSEDPSKLDGLQLVPRSMPADLVAKLSKLREE